MTNAKTKVWVKRVFGAWKGYRPELLMFIDVAFESVERNQPGTVVIGQEVLHEYLRTKLAGTLDDLRLELGERSVVVDGTIKRMGVRSSVKLELTHQQFAPSEGIGTLSFRTDGLSLVADGGMLNELLVAIGMLICSRILGIDPVERAVNSIDFVTIANGLAVVDIDSAPGVLDVLERQVVVGKVGELFDVTDIVFAPAEIRVVATASERSRRLLGSLNRLKNGAKGVNALLGAAGRLRAGMRKAKDKAAEPAEPRIGEAPTEAEESESDGEVADDGVTRD